MRKTVSKMMAVMLALIMTMAMMSACSGGSSSGAGESSGGEGTESAETAAEPNAGIEGIVFVIPDNWKMLNSMERHTTYEIPGSDFMFGATAMSEDDLKDMPDEMKTDTLDEYFEKYFHADDETIKENNLEQSELSICDSTAYHTLRKNDDGSYISTSVGFVYEGLIYELYLFNYKAYDDQGNRKDDASPLTDEEVAAFDAIIASVQPGDGKSLAGAANAPAEIGEFTYEIPEGYSVTGYFDSYVGMEKEGSKITLSLNLMDEEGVKNIKEGDDTPYASLEEYSNSVREDASEITEVAGFDAAVYKYPDEDGNLYNYGVEILADDGVYSVHMDADAYDDDGNFVEGTEPLTEEDIAVFDAFLSSLKKK